MHACFIVCLLSADMLLMAGKLYKRIFFLSTFKTFTDLPLSNATLRAVNDLGFTDVCRAYKNETIRAIEILGKKREKFDIIFMDPPYKDEVCSQTIKAIEKAEILEENGLIIAEHHLAEKMPDELGSYKKVDERVYSIKVMSFYTKG